MTLTKENSISDIIAVINNLTNEQMEKDGRIAIKQAIESKGVTLTVADSTNPTYQELDTSIRNSLGIPKAINTKMIRDIYRATFGSSAGGLNVTNVTETKNYVWYVYNDSKTLLRFPKSNPLDVQYYKTSASVSTSYTISSLIPLYELDKIIITYAATSYILIMNANMTVEYLSSAFASPNINTMMGYYYNPTSKHLYLISFNTNCTFWDIDLTDTKNPVNVRTVTLYQISGGESYQFCMFEPGNNAVRVISTWNSATQINRRYSLIDGSLIASYDGVLSAFANTTYPSFKATADLANIVWINNNDVRKLALNTGTQIASKSLATLRTEILSKLSVGATVGTITTSVLHLLSNGNYMAFCQITLSSGLTNNLECWYSFEIDENLNVVYIEPTFGAYAFANYGGYNFRNIRTNERYIANLNTPQSEIYLLK